MRLTAVTLHGTRLPLLDPFVTSFAHWTDREFLLVEVRAEVDGAEVTGWGECAAFAEPTYTPEYLDGCAEVIERFLWPLLVSTNEINNTETVGDVLRPVKANRMAKAALEMAILDGQLRARGQSLANYLGGVVDRVPAGVAVGLYDTRNELVRAVLGRVDEGYRRVKLKIAPGSDLDAVSAVRDAVGPDLGLQVDANGAYTLDDVDHLRRLDEFDLQLIEQPLGEEDLHGHAQLARQIETPICLDESVVSYDAAAHAIAIGAASVLAIKPGRVGGYLEARRIHDLAQQRGIPVSCGGMLETGLARTANVALTSLPGFTLPGDLSASHRFYARDLTSPVELEDGYLRVSTVPGIGAEPIPEELDRARTFRRELKVR